MRALTRARLAGVMVLGLSALPGLAAAETVQMHATLNGVAQVPPTDTAGTGTADVTFDTGTRLLTWTIVYQKLSGPPTAMHFHGPATPDKNAGPIVPLNGSLDSPIHGSHTITAANAADLMAGLWYLNIHTDAHPAGEIRGQVMKAQ